MGLFDRYHLPLADAESSLGRRLEGDPTQGEIAVITALNHDQFKEARRIFENDSSLRADFRSLVEPKLRGAIVRNDQHGIFRVRLPSSVVDHYQSHSLKRNTAIPQLLEEDLARAVDQRREGADLLGSLRDQVTAFQRSMNELLVVLRDLASSASNSNLELRLANIERCLQSLTTHRR